MLLSFSVTNYKVFRDTVTLDMTATSDKRHEDNLILMDGRHRTLRTCAIYGANASGKTTLFNAMTLFRNFVIQSPAHQDNVKLNHTPFALDVKSLKRPTEFRVEFKTDGIRYDYGFSYDSDAICEEHLIYYPNGRKTVVFVRDGKNYFFNADKKFREGNARRVRSKSLFLSVSAQFNDEVCISAANWIVNDFAVLCGIDQSMSIDYLLNLMESDKRVSRLMIRAFKIADFGITRIYDNNKKRKNAPSAPGAIDMGIPFPMKDIRVEHDVNGHKVTFPLAAESAGTIRFMSVIGPIIVSLLRGSTIAIDEMDMSFHTDVCQWIVGLFLDPSENRRDAQLIFNTHETGLLDQSVIRRDQVWFTMKDWETGAAELRRLSDYKIRNDLDIRKAYLNGSFGAKPFIAPERLMEGL